MEMCLSHVCLAVFWLAQLLVHEWLLACKFESINQLKYSTFPLAYVLIVVLVL